MAAADSTDAQSTGMMDMLDTYLLSEQRRRQLNMSEEKLGIRTATIYIHMHGSFRGHRETTIPLPTTSSYTLIPTNSAIGGSMGLCLFANKINRDKRFLDTLNLSMDLYSRYNIPEANRLFIEKGLWDPYTSGAIKMIFESDAEFKKTYPNEYKLPYGRFNLTRRYAMPQRTTDFLRSYSHDKVYTLGDDEREQSFMGIYLIHTNHIKLRDSYTECLSLVTTPSDTPVYTALQQNNLVNKECVDQLLRLYSKGLAYPLRNPLPSTEIIHSNAKYKSIFLSDILKLFGRLGIQHLNIIDHSCNVVYHDVPHGLQRQYSSTAKEEYIEKTKPLDVGGKRKKTKRRYRK